MIHTSTDQIVKLNSKAFFFLKMGVENFSQTSKGGGQVQIFKKGIKEWERGGLL